MRTTFLLTALVAIVLATFVHRVAAAPGDLDTTFNGTGSLANGLVAYYPFNGNANDVSGNANHGIVSGATLTTDRFGSPNHAYHFDGGQQWIDLPDLTSVTSQVTITFWANLTAQTESGDFFAFNARDWHNNGGVVCGWRSPWRDGEGILVDVYGVSPVEHGLALSHPLNFSSSRNRWNFYALTIDVAQKTIKLYFNGVLVESRVLSDFPVSLALKPSIGGHFDLGGHGSLRTWIGDIAEVRIYNRTVSDAEITLLATEGGPAIGGVIPNPVSGRNSPQTFVINGTAFDANCTVTLRNLTTGAIYPNRAKVTQATNSITLNPNFSANPATWSVEVINPGNISSGQYQFQVTGAATLVSVTVTGPANVAAGSSTRYTATATYSNGTIQDVTGQSSWSVTGGPGGTRMTGSTLITGSGFASSPTVTARIANNTGSRSASVSVTIGIGLSVGILSVAHSYIPIPLSNAASPSTADSGALNYRLQATSVPIGGTGNLTTSWSLDSTPIGTGSGLVLDVNYLASPGNHSLKVSVTDSSGLTAESTTAIFLTKAPQLNEQNSKVGNNLPNPGRLYAADATQGYDPNSGPDPSKGLVVIIHGMDGKVTAAPGPDGLDNWMMRMADAITKNLVTEAPKFILYDWKKDADTSTTTGATFQASLKEFSGQVMPADASFAKRLTAANEKIAAGAAVTAVGLSSGTITAANALSLRSIADTHGVELANYIKGEILAGRVSPFAPIHLIGHSAGGFVAANCGWALLADQTLQTSGKTPITLRVTTLDTPFLTFNHITFVRKLGGTFERYVSSAIGEIVPGVVLVKSYDALESALSSVWSGLQSIAAYFTGTAPAPGYEEAVDYHSGADIEVSGYWDAITQHKHAHEWYIHTIQIPNSFGEGFYYSPFPGGHPFPSGGQAAPAGRAANASALAGASGKIASPDVALPVFSTFGNVVQSVGAYTLTEQGNAGIYQSVTLPMNASTVKFRVQFTQPGDGDFVEVSFGDHLSLAVIADGSILRAGPVQFEVPVVVYGGETGQLLFKLNGVGADNAVAVIDNITITTDDDADGDGLTFAQEIALGTDPRYADTDGDGISDGDEVNIYHTSPLMADTDGDGIPDGAEIAAGTDPNSSDSYFRVANIQRTLAGGLALTWPCVAGKSYQVWRSTDITFANFDVIASGLSAVTSTLTFTDTSPPVITQGGVFYRVALEP